MTGSVQATPTVDSHQHFWELGRFHYPWMPPPPSVILRDYLPQDLAPLLEEAGIQHTVLVQAHQSVEEAEWLLDIADRTPFVAGVVAWVDLTDPGVGRTLDRLMARPKLVGIRHQVEDDPDDAWLVRDDAVRGLREVARRGLAYDLLVRPRHLKYVPRLAELVPDLRMVVDHIAKPPIASGRMEPWARDMAAIAEIPGIHCKVSGMVTEADHRRWTVEDLKPYVAHVRRIFSVERLMFGSDWPVCLLAASYRRVYEAALEALGPMTEEERAAFLGGNAARFYRLDLA